MIPALPSLKDKLALKVDEVVPEKDTQNNQNKETKETKVVISKTKKK